MSHKYLHVGVTLSSDAKWNNHIENIILNVSRHLGILRKLKYRLSRQILEKLYLVYICPIFSSHGPKGQVSYCHHLASVVVVRRTL